MTQYLPPNLLALFAPRDPISFMPQLAKLPHEKKSVPYSGIAGFINQFEDPHDTPPPTRTETKDERLERKKKERAEQVAYKLEQDLALWDPASNVNGTTDPYKTLFVARINYDTSESKMRREFETYGPVKKIQLVTSIKTGKPRGYAFVEYEHERDMHAAYKHADGRKIDGRRVLVDVERARTVKGWRPRRLGGGLGGTRKGGPDVNTKYSGRDDNMMTRSRSRSRERGRGRRSRSRDRRRRSRSRDRRRRSISGDRSRRRRSRSRDRRRRSRSRDRRRRSPRRDREERERKFPMVKPEPQDNYEYSNVAVHEDFEYDPNMPLKIKDIKKEEGSDNKDWHEQGMVPEGPMPPEAMEMDNNEQYDPYQQHYQVKAPDDLKQEPQ